MKIIPAIIAITFGILASALAEDLSSKEYVQKGRLAVIAFQNSYLAIMAKDEKLAEKLFNLGYDSGKEFLAAYRSKKVNPDDTKELPIIFGWIAQGPSDDFILGRLYQAMKEDAQKELLDETKDDKSDDAVKSAAERKLRKGNAELLIKPN